MIAAMMFEAAWWKRYCGSIAFPASEKEEMLIIMDLDCSQTVESGHLNEEIK